MKKKY